MMTPISMSPEYVSQNKAPPLLAVMWTFTSLSIVFVFARLYTRASVLRLMGFDDWLILISLVFSILFVSLITAAMDAGMGRHAATLTDAQFERAQLLNAASFAPGLLSFSVPKIAVVALLSKILNPSRRQNYILWSFALGTTLAACGCIAIFFAQCTPTKALWDPNVVPRCWNPHILVNFSIFTGVYSAIADLYLAIYPGFVLWKLQMNKKKKMGLSIALGLGSAACAVTIYKCTRLPGLLDRSDSTYSTTDLFAWTSIESNTIIIAASIPTLQPLLEIIFGQGAFRSTPRGYTSNSRGPRGGRIRLSNVEDRGSHKDLGSRHDHFGHSHADSGIAREASHGVYDGKHWHTAHIETRPVLHEANQQHRGDGADITRPDSRSEFKFELEPGRNP